MDEENFFWSVPEDVPAEIQIDGEVTETYTGEQVADEAGNASWWDENYPGQTTNTADSPTQDAYGLNILSAAETQELTRNINPAFINNLVDPNTPTVQTTKNAVNTSATNAPVYVDSNGVVFNSATGLSYPVDRTTGKQIIPADVAASIDPAAQNRINTFNQQPIISATSVNPRQSNLAGPPDTFIKDANGDWQPNPKYVVNTSPTPVAASSPYTETRQTAVDAARLNAQSPNPYLANIDQAAAEISRGQEGIATATQNIKSAQQNIADSESVIAQQNAELADPNISAERRAVLEANNAEQTQNIFDQTQSINENQAYIANTQDTIQFNEASIDANSASYRATTSGANVPVVDVNADPNFVRPQQITPTVVNPTTNAAPVNVQDGQAFGPVFPDPNGNGGFVDSAGNPVNADGTPIFPASRFTTATAVDPANTGFTPAAGAGTAPFFGSNPDAEQEAAAAAQVGRQLAQQQAVNAAQKRVVNNSDWRVRLQLAPGANYLYNAPQPGILWPLRQTDGVIFPYTPKIMMNYKADYEATALTHSNYKGYFYKGSYTDQVSLSATFTAQDTSEAEYLLAVIHFFRSVTKMFYGQDPNRGAPPPLVYLTGLGEYQFTQHPCAVANFNYSLPSDVDYIRARSTNINGTNLVTRRNQQSLPTNPISGAVARLQNLFSSQGINKGALFYPPPVPNLGQNQPTYVPTKIDIELALYPMQSRQQVSRVFDNRQYNNGAQLKGGFW